MPLEIRPLAEEDVWEYHDIFNKAFKGTLVSNLSPPPTETSMQEQVEKTKKTMHTEPDLRLLKVVDTDLDDRIVACAKWRINEKERTEEEIQTMLPKPNREKDSAISIELQDYLTRVRKQYMGTKPFVFLSLLITHPEHQRRGAGAMLIQWGLDKADELKLPSFLEASDAGKPLYERFGFETQEVTTWDNTKYVSARCTLQMQMTNFYRYGFEGITTNSAMIRPART